MMRLLSRTIVFAAIGTLLIACNSAQKERPVASTTASNSPIVIYPIVGRFGDTGDVLSGGSVDNLIEGIYPLRARSRTSGLACEVLSKAPGVTSRANACLGQEGTISFSCENGREVETTWQAETCTSGYGVGTDNRGNRFDYAFGMPRTVAIAHFGQVQEFESSGGGQVATIIVPPVIAIPPVTSGPNVQEPQTAGTAPEPPLSSGDTYADLIHLATGTGFFVTADGYLLTNYHVVRNAEVIDVILAGSPVEATIKELDPSNDLALLKIDAKTVPLPLPPVPSYERGGDVMTLGFPLPDFNAASQKATFGRINDLSGLHGDPRFIQMDVPVQPGNSGGPLFNTKGEVIGIVTSRVDDVVVIEKSGTVPQNMNYAVKADYARPLVNRLKSPITPSGADQALSFAELAAKYEDSVVLLVTYGYRDD